MNEVVHFRRINFKDLKTLFVFRNDKRVYKWCRQFTPLSWESHVKWFEKQNTDVSIEMFAIVDNYDLLHGVCGLTDIDYVNSRAEFSLYINPEKHGRGFGKASLSKLLDVAFKNYNLNLVWGETFSLNPASKMFKSLGFKFDGSRRQFYYRDGEYIDAHLYSITKEEFLGI